MIPWIQALPQLDLTADLQVQVTCTLEIKQTSSKYIAAMKTVSSVCFLMSVNDEAVNRRKELFRCQISDDICRLIFFFNKLLLGKKCICKVERLNHLDLCCLQTILLLPVAVKALMYIKWNGTRN